MGQMRYVGRITTWKDDKGFGFITPGDGSAKVFLHVSALSNRQRRPEENELVTYELAIDDKGRRQARAVAFSGERPAPAPHSGHSALPPLFALCFLLFVGAMVFLDYLPGKVLALYLVASLITLFAYILDKSAALHNQWRTQESTLHVLALVGGWPGALAAQRMLRHKTAKSSFQIVFWITVALNCGALGWLLSPLGAGVLALVFEL
jgi:uncharacterized membrane protein YsdA (DUF1294 family)/cold shock CspA family protein